MAEHGRFLGEQRVESRRVYFGAFKPRPGIAVRVVRVYRSHEIQRQAPVFLEAIERFEG